MSLRGVTRSETTKQSSNFKYNMIPFTTLTSTVIPLPRKDIDTDLIIPAQYLTSTAPMGTSLSSPENSQNPRISGSESSASGAASQATFACLPAGRLRTARLATSGGYGVHLFQRLRDQDPNFVLNQEKYRDAKIIVAGDNFGCGSSREHAVWALLEYGIRVIIAPSFADIFTSNSLKNGLLLVKIPEKEMKSIMKSQGVSVDLARQMLTLADGSEISFPFDPFRKECILNGYDDLDYLLAHEKEINEWNVKNKKSGGGDGS